MPVLIRQKEGERERESVLRHHALTFLAPLRSSACARTKANDEELKILTQALRYVDVSEAGAKSEGGAKRGRPAIGRGDGGVAAWWQSAGRVWSAVASPQIDTTARTVLCAAAVAAIAGAVAWRMARRA